MVRVPAGPFRVGERSEGSRGEDVPTMTQTTFTIAVLVIGFTIAALFVLTAMSMGAVAGT